MLRSEFLLEIIRYKKSYDFIVDKDYQYDGDGSRDNPFTSKDYKNNIKNNMQDLARLYLNGFIIWSCNRIQTVANYPLCDMYDTIAPGKFQLLCFVDQRRYDHEIHGIINAYDIEGQKILHNSMQWEDNHWKGRFLMHATKYRHAWSKACQMPSRANMLDFNLILYDNNVKPKDIIPGFLKEKE